MSASAGPRGVPSEADVKEISDLLGKGIEARRKELGLTTDRTLDHRSIVADLGTLAADYDIYNTAFSSRRRLFGSVVIYVKKLLREFLNPILVRQVAYNGANSRVAAYLAAKVEALEQNASEFRRLVDDTAERVTRVEREVESQRELGQRFDGTGEGTARLAEERLALQNVLSRLQLQIDDLRSLNQRHAVALETMANRLSGTERELRRIIYTLRVMRWLRKKGAA
jgi:hypothetical protein